MSLTGIKTPQYRIFLGGGLDGFRTLYDIIVCHTSEVGPGTGQCGRCLVTVFHEILPNHHIIGLACQTLRAVICSRILKCQFPGDIQMPTDEHSRIEAGGGESDPYCFILFHTVSVRSLYCFNFFKACNTKVRL